MRYVYAVILLLLATWGVFASHKVFATERRWSKYRFLSYCSIILFVAGTLFSGIGLMTNRFESWMLIPIAASYYMMLPLPCYFPWITETIRRRTVRNAIFVAIATLLLALGLGIIPVSAIGL